MSTNRKRQPKRLEDFSAAKQKKIIERIKLCGYEDLEAEELLRECGRLAFELFQLKEDKKLEMEGYNNTIKDIEERIEALRIQKDLMRAPPPKLVQG
jgi:hypothetical protein